MAGCSCKRLGVCAFGLALMVLRGSEAHAQLVQGPAGAIRGVFGGRQPLTPGGSTQRWTVTGDAATGEDREPIEIPGGANLLLNGRTATMGTVLSRYFRGQAANFFEVSGGGFVTRQSLATQDLRGVNGGTRFLRSFGTRSGVSGAVDASYQPFQILAAPLTPTSAPTDTGTAVPADAGALLGVQQQRLVYALMRADTFRSWTPRHRFEVGGSRSQWSAVSGPDLEDRSDSITARESWNMTQRTELFGQYRFSRNYRNLGPGTERRGRVQAAEAGLRLERRLSPQRNVIYQVQGGLAQVAAYAQVTADPVTSIQTVGSGTVQVNFSENWSVVVRANREVSALNGVTPEPFVMSQVLAQFNGTAFRRLGIWASSAYGRGDGASDSSANFNGTTTLLRLQYGLASWAGVFTSYSLYRHQLFGVPAVLAGFPNRYERHAVRFGVTLWAPLYGTF